MKDFLERLIDGDALVPLPARFDLVPVSTDMYVRLWTTRGADA